MKNGYLFLVLLMSFNLFAQPLVGEKSGMQKKTNPKAAGCVPPTTSTLMELNNVRYLAHTAGNMWQVPTKNFSQYEVPKNSGIMALFTAALWLGGTDANNQLKLAALRYRNGQDYWTGPLSQGNAETNSDNCNKYDRHFITSQDDIRNFAAWFAAGKEDEKNGTSTQSDLFPDFKIPEIIKEWPAHGDLSQGQDFYLAPFFDQNEDGLYNYLDGDYPYHDIYKTRDCNNDRKVLLYGDLNFWWVMNDKGNIHTETNADPIGMEIRGQTFCFASNDEINNMSFYNYEIINRGTLTLFNTYFGFFTDGALGNPFDDYVGCDVNRGLAYYYNGNNVDLDNTGFLGYGENPPAVGVDFFEGPFQDNDGLDNGYGIGENEALNGIGYGDGIIDNERFGMRRFLYYSNTTNGADPSQTDPIGASDYYNYLRGYWKDGSPFFYGGSGHFSDAGANQQVPCQFMFPGDTDPLGWGTGGAPQAPWTEQTAGNPPNDRRFVQSAGPFVLKPGAVNNITVGVVYARASSGDPFASVESLRRADDKAQSLFENCFKIIDAPHAPELRIQELENELILTLFNGPNSNNYKEQYVEIDPFIVSTNPNADKAYRFQGYQIFQLESNAVSPSDLTNPNLARLVAQCDITDGIKRLINFEFDESLQASRPVEKVNGSDKGIRHSFQIKEDQFAQGNRTLVNFKRYYFMAVAYAYNNFKNYNPSDPDALDGQQKPYLQSRKAANGDIKVIEAIPHNPMPEAGGTFSYIEYGASPEIRRIDGHGNGGRELDLNSASHQQIMRNGFMEQPTYQQNKGPIGLKVIDPLNVQPGYYECKFRDFATNSVKNSADTAHWTIYRYDKENGTIMDSMQSESTISFDQEQLIPKWGVSISIFQIKDIVGGTMNTPTDLSARYLSSSIQFADSSKSWLQFIQDQNNFFPTNWIRSGASSLTPPPDYNPALTYRNEACYPVENGDIAQQWTRVLNGGFAPHRLVGYQCDFMPIAYLKASNLYPNGIESDPGTIRSGAALSFLPSVDIIITSDQSKWTRCPVIELGRDPNLNQNSAKPGELRKSASVGKNGQSDNTGTGMGWFPGYAIDIETGSRLYMAFGENSFLRFKGLPVFSLNN
ncbi:MAG: T9SS C-terminal target domain-containing protein [Bacteroidetes bacterium]|nr:T9SS C-terminal target domain-containing protein [Bacteroidota bacterium]